jgi:hypothetical protein
MNSVKVGNVYMDSTHTVPHTHITTSFRSVLAPRWETH